MKNLINSLSITLPKCNVVCMIRVYICSTFYRQIHLERWRMGFARYVTLIIMILLVVLYGYDTLSRTLREKHRLTVFQSSVMSKIFGQKRDYVTGGWRKLHNEELHSLCAKYEYN
jgi:hypothetical protein